MVAAAVIASANRAPLRARPAIFSNRTFPMVVSDWHRSAMIAQRRSADARSRAIKRANAQAWSDCKEPPPKLQRTVMDKFPSFEVFSRYTKPLLPTSCQHPQVLLFEREIP